MIFPNSERKKKPIHVPIVTIIHRLKSLQCGSDVFKILERSRYSYLSSRAKKKNYMEPPERAQSSPLSIIYREWQSLRKISVAARCPEENSWHVIIIKYLWKSSAYHSSDVPHHSQTNHVSTTNASNSRRNSDWLWINILSTNSVEWIIPLD